MKFVCDKCNTRYSIADERVHGRVLKIRCKACNNVITVREEHHAPAPSLAPGVAGDSLEDALQNFQQRDDEQTRVSTSPPAAPEGADDWYVSFDGEQEGPLPLARALDRVRAERPRGKECFCWRGGFFVWLPVEEVPEFAPALVKLPPPIPAVRPRPATGAQPAVKSATGKQAALRSPTGSQQAVRSPTGQQAAIKSPTGQQQAVRSPTGQQPALKSPTGSLPTIRGIGDMNASPFPGDLPPMDSGPLGTPASLLPSMETKPEPRLMRKDEPQPLQPTVLPDSGPSTLSPFAAALQVSGPTQVAGDAPKHVPAPKGLMTMDSGPVPLPPPPGNDLPIDEPSGLVNLSHVSKPSMSSPMNQSKPLVETFGGVAVTPSKPTPAPQPIIVSPGRAGAPGWLKWAALAGASATVALLVVVVVLMQRKPTVIVVPPAPTLDNGKKVADRPITVEDTGPTPTPPTAGASGTTGGTSAQRSQKRPPSSARAGTTPKPPAENLSNAQRNLASLYRDDGTTEHVAGKSVGSAGEARGGGSQVSQQAIMSVVTQNRRSLNLCYDRVLKHDSSLKSGRVVTHVRIGISGSVTGVQVPDPQYANSEIGQCIAQTIKHWHFPAADAEYETEFPIILQAN
ncbi:MAG TPA: AgmX/PglI C-terminal domain-containing protein [Polyangia bacterium]|jgi:predicted Zn finger-like uncharacterized protein